MGENYGSVNIGQGDKLQKINNWNWLKPLSLKKENTGKLNQ